MSDVPAALTRRLSFLLGTLHARSVETEAHELGAVGMSIKEHAALAVLVDEGPMTQQDLGRRLGIDRTTVVAVVDALAHHGHVERHRDPDDRRAYLVTPTPAGTRSLERGSTHVADAERSVLAALRPDEQHLLTELLGRALGGPSPGVTS